MSDETKPFAVVYGGDFMENVRPHLYIGEIVKVHPHEDEWHQDAVEEFEREAKQLNASVTARERKAAAQALREAAKAYDSEPQTMTHYDCIAEALRARAESIEKGNK
jgi:uncharacterized protein YukE